MTIRYIIERFTLAFIAKAGSRTRIRYWRRQGIKIGEQCLINNVNFSTEPYLIEIGDHVAIAAGTDFITHDGAIWCFRDEIENADVFGKIKVGNNVFIGNNCTILPNTVIGNNCIVGAGSVVRGLIPGQFSYSRQSCKSSNATKHAKAFLSAESEFFYYQKS